MRLNNRTALITGASHGIGREIALAFAHEGADVAVTARSTEDLETLCKQNQSLGRRAVAISADLYQRASIDQVVDEAMAALGRIDILVNNAGIGSSFDPRPIQDFDDEIWDKSLMLNLTVPYLLIKRVLPGMIERKEGRIINIASVAARRGVFHGCAYAASKAGVVGLTIAAARDLARSGVTVNAINPGPTKTEMNDKRIAYDAKRLGKSIEDYEPTVTPIGRRLDPWEIAPVAVYLASCESACVTGQSWNVDGGCSMG